MLPKTTDFWGNIFTFVEGTGPANGAKKSCAKDVTPGIPTLDSLSNMQGLKYCPICLVHGNM
jgi:hypothetical protein